MKRKFYNIKGVEEGCSIRIMFNVLPKELTDIREYDILDLKQHVLNMGGKHVVTPRLQTAFGDEGSYYSFSGAVARAHKWTPFLTKVKEYIEQVTELTFNFVLINKYRDGNDSIVSVTIGCVRDFVLKNNSTKKSITIPLPHNSCLIFNEKTNKKYKHSVPVRKKCTSAKYNLTFRTIVN